MTKKKTTTRTIRLKATVKPRTSSRSRNAITSTRLNTAKKNTRSTGIAHHVKRLYRVTPKFVHGMVVGAVVGIMVLVPLGKSNDAGALTISSPKDCDSWSIVNCGVKSTNHIKNVYGDSGYVRTVFGHFKISSGDVSAIGKRAVKGTVYANGDVKVNGKLVATNAVTAARKRVTASDQKVVINGKTFFKRHLSAGWSHSSGPAYVVFNSDGIFEYAILASCGNPITATPKIPPAKLLCSNLKYSLINKEDRNYEFKATASAKNTTITHYVFHFGDGKKATVKTSATNASAKHKFAKSNHKYTAYVVVSSTRKSGVTSANCKVSLTTSQQPPILTCDSLTAKIVPNKPNTFEFIAKASAKRTTITSYVFNFGDGQTATVKTGKTSTFVTRTFPVNITRIVTVSVSSKDFKNVSSPACRATITTHTDECKPGVPVGSPDCEDKPSIHLTNVRELPNTGIGALLIVLAFSIIGGTIFHKTHRHITHKRRARRHGHHA